MKEKYLKKLKMKKNMDFFFNFQMIKYLMKRKCFVLVQKVNVIGKEEIRFFGLEEIAKNMVVREN